MGTCKYCSASGFFLRTGELGVCSKCEPLIREVVSERLRLITESQTIINASRSIRTKLSRLDIIIDKLKDLKELESRGIRFGVKNLAGALQEACVHKDRVIVEEAAEVVATARQKRELASSAKSAASALSGAVIKIVDLKKSAMDPEPLSRIERELKEEIRQIQLDSFLAAAHKHEFKGDFKKAIDQHQEALYFLKTDAIDDRKQQDVIREIEHKIALLRKRIEAD